MRLWPILLSQTLGLLIAGLISLSPPAQAQDALQDSELVDALKQGGYADDS